MANNFGCRHSRDLQVFFEIEARGIDYINECGIKFEFKESFARDLKKLFFKCPYEQLLNADYFVFCVRDKEFYVHCTSAVIYKYNFKNERKHCCLRYNTIRANYIYKTDNYQDLRVWIDRRDC